jgi:hypothetical protein
MGGKSVHSPWPDPAQYLLIIWEGVVLPETAPSHKRLLHPKLPINLDGEEKTVADGCEGYINTVDYFK